MRYFLESMWLPSLLFALPIFLLLAIWSAPGLAVVYALYVAMVVAWVWGMTTRGHQRVSFARRVATGALCGAVLVLLPAIAVTVAVALASSDGMAMAAYVLAYQALAVAAVFLVAGGACIGALTALLQTRGLGNGLPPEL